MTDLNFPCRVCGETWGSHPASYYNNDCSFVMEAVRMTYDDAQCLRYAVGMWSQDRWEAYTAYAPYSMHRYPLAFPVPSEVARLMVLIGDHLATIRPLEPEAFRRLEAARSQIMEVA